MTHDEKIHEAALALDNGEQDRKRASERARLSQLVKHLDSLVAAAEAKEQVVAWASWLARELDRTSNELMEAQAENAKLMATVEGYQLAIEEFEREVAQHEDCFLFVEMLANRITFLEGRLTDCQKRNTELLMQNRALEAERGGVYGKTNGEE